MSVNKFCIRWHRTGAYYTAKLTFSYSSSSKVLGAHYTRLRIIFEFIRYLLTYLLTQRTSFMLQILIPYHQKTSTPVKGKTITMQKELLVTKTTLQLVTARET